MLWLYKYIYELRRGRKTTNDLHDILDRPINPEIPKLWASLFHIHLQAKVAACTPFPPARASSERGESIVSVEATPVCAR